MIKYICVLCLSVFLLVSGCNPAAGSDDPKAVVLKFLNSVANKDIDDAKKYVTRESESFMNMIKVGMNMAGENQKQLFNISKIIIGEAVINGDKATVTIKEKYSNNATNIILEKETGAWKVAFDMAAFMEMSGANVENLNPLNKQDGLRAETLKEAKDALNNLSDSDKQKAGKAMDSLTNMYKELNKNGKMEEAFKEATQMLENMQKKKQ